MLKVKKGKNKNFDKIEKEKINNIKFYEKQYRYNDALLLIDDFLYEYPDNNYIKVYKCLILLKLNRSKEGEELLVKIINNDDLKIRDKLFAYNVYGKILSSLDKFDEAIHIYELLLNLSDDIELVPRTELSTLYLRQNNIKAALDVLKIDGYNTRILNIKRAYVYCKIGKYNKALSSFDIPIENKYNYNPIECFDESYLNQSENYVKGYINYRKRNYDEALTYLYNALMPKNNLLYYKSYIIIAKIKIASLKVDETIEICNNLLNNNPKDGIKKNIYSVLSKAYIRKSDYDTARNRLGNCEYDVIKTNTAFAKIEISRGNFEEAEKYLEFLDFNEYDIYSCYDSYYRLALVKFRLGKFDEFKKIEEYFLNTNDQEIINNMKYEFRRMRLMIDIKENKQIEKKEYSYSENQIISYNSDLAIEHIIDHHKINCKFSTFNENIDIKSLFNYAREIIKDKEPTCDSSYDRYIVKYNNIGKNLDGDNINQLLIVTIPYTNNIITMYPYDGFESLLIMEDENKINKPKIKRLSQIEKFNKKYNKGD